MPSYRRGDVGPAVAEIRDHLSRLGLLDAPVGSSDDYDAACDRAVRQFQQSRGLSVDGVVGEQTYRTLDEARWRLGDRLLSYSVVKPFVGDDVAELQQRLLEMGFDPGRCDGILGPRTEAALRDLQRNVGLTSDGTCGPQTLKALHRLARTVVGGRAQGLREFERFHASVRTLAGRSVLLDPGHGGDDKGIQAHGLIEAELMTDLAARIEGRLVATGVQVYLTRGPELELSDVDRARFANAAEADLLISLHMDEHPDPAANGVATYYYGSPERNMGSVLGERFASLVQEEIIGRTGLLDCRTHAKTWDLLRLTRMPAVRIDLGYLTNADDANRVAAGDFRDAVAEAIVVAIQRLYVPELEAADSVSAQRVAALT
ncbi:MAG: N-acetylmuramoyl-L-alanine amidase [Frankiaceae bacterium]|nr:N-acetylmuramoyl-L-alanine amidase [Frankiaceae bacterium]